MSTWRTSRRSSTNCRVAAERQAGRAIARRWPTLLLGGLILAIVIARWLPASLRDTIPYAATAAGFVGVALLFRARGGKGWKIALTALALPFWLLAAGAAWPEPRAPLPPRLPASYVIDHVRVVDVAAGTVSAPTHIHVADGVIQAIGETPSVAHRIDGKGAYVVPGFWDMHVHSFATTPQLAHALMLSHGITSVRDMMNCAAPRDPLVACIEDKKAWSAQAEAGDRAGPRYVGLASFYFDDPALTPAEVTRRAEAYVRSGATELKVYNRLTLPGYRALAEVSRRTGVPIAGHLPRAVPLETALALGQRRFEHARLLPDACGGAIDPRLPPALRTRATLARFDRVRCAALIDRMAAAGAVLVPTHVTRDDDVRAQAGNVQGLEWLDPLSRWAWHDDAAGTAAAYPGPHGAALLRAYHKRGLALTGVAHRRGVTVLAGTDTVPGGPRYHDELAMLVEAGLSPAEALRAATVSAARFSGKGARFGTVAPDKAADLVLLESNPLDDIAATRTIHGLVFAGRHYRDADLQALRDFTRRQANHPANWAKILWGFITSPSASEL